ncbi:MAG: aminotransferase class I/II-fold pyridoxal phosphate-dependent enzyme, partial [bacterium]|nr:aminotransferase class I/II-fold pyridoxal phosphate-dependent enzyme [bacterium]
FAMTGWRVGYAVGPVHVIDKIGLLSQTIVSCVPPFLQDACVIALKNKKEFSERYSIVYKKLRDIVCDALSKSEEISFTKPAGAFYCMIDVSGTGLNGDMFADHLLKEEGVVVCPGSGFGPSGANYVRICYARPEQEIKEGCEKIVRVAKNLATCLSSRPSL